MIESQNVLDKIVPLDEALQANHILRVYIGGTGSEALKFPSTNFDPSAETIEPAPGFSIPLRRTDGTYVDIDLQINSTDTAQVATARTLAATQLPDMEVKPFGLHTDARLKEQCAAPTSAVAKKVGTADRYVTKNPDGSRTVTKAAFPFAFDATDIIEPWQLVVEGYDPLPVASPYATISNYLTRSIGGGLRGRYDEKMGRIVSNVLEAMPEVQEYFMDGRGQAHLAMAGCLRSIATFRHPDKPWVIGTPGRRNLEITVPRWRDVMDQPVSLIRNESDEVKKAVLNYCRLKAPAMKFVEGNRLMMWVWHHLKLENVGTIQKITNND